MQSNIHNTKQTQAMELFMNWKDKEYKTHIHIPSLFWWNQASRKCNFEKDVWDKQYALSKTCDKQGQTTHDYTSCSLKNTYVCLHFEYFFYKIRITLIFRECSLKYIVRRVIFLCNKTEIQNGSISMQSGCWLVHKSALIKNLCICRDVE